MSDLVVQFDTIYGFDVAFGLELFNSSITKLNANVVDHLIQASGVKHHIIFHLFEIGFIPSSLNKVTINLIKLRDPVIIKLLIQSRKIQESLRDCVVDLGLIHAGCFPLNKAKITGRAPLVGYLVSSPRIVTSLLSCLGL